jgi:hypothetical protein
VNKVNQVSIPKLDNLDQLRNSVVNVINNLVLEINKGLNPPIVDYANQSVINLRTPSQPGDAANKLYVDSLIDNQRPKLAAVTRYETSNFFIGLCDPLIVANDIANYAPVGIPGWCSMVLFTAKTPATTTACILDIKKAIIDPLDNTIVTWSSIFKPEVVGQSPNANKIIIPPGNTFTGIQFGTFKEVAPAYGFLETGDRLRLDVLQSGNTTANVTIKLYHNAVAPPHTSAFGASRVLYHYPEGLL